MRFSIRRLEFLKLSFHDLFSKGYNNRLNVGRYVTAQSCSQCFSRELALRARCVNPALDPGGSGKELVRKGSGTIRARLARG